MIIGRAPEKNKLKKLLTSTEAEFLIVYGRRRVGKTFLIREYFNKNLVFDFTGAFNANIDTQLENFFGEYLGRTKGQKETNIPNSWTRAFKYLADYLSTLSKKEKHVVFIDELPWLDTHKSGFVSAFEFFWNQYVSKMSHIVLVGCGSATSWIQKKILKAKGGLYNRTTSKIRLEPFNLAETAAYLKHKKIKLTQYQIILLYMVMGGIPFYLREVERGLSAEQVIDHICFNKSGLLFDEYEQLYPSIFSQHENHIAIMQSLASKPNGLTRNKLVQLSKLADGGLFTRTITELIDAGFIEILYPFGKIKRQSVYKIADFYSLFYYKFIKKNKGSGKGTWLRIAKSSSFKAWSGYAFESICLKHIDQIKKSLGISGMWTNTVSWTFNGNKELPGSQIDLIIDREDQMIVLCEAKFTQENFMMTKKYANQLRQKEVVFKAITKTKKSIMNVLITTYPAFKNEAYLDLVDKEIIIDDLFKE